MTDLLINPKEEFMQQSLGLLGGTFDPIHRGHLQLALAAYSVLSLQEIRFIPCAQPLLRDPPIATAQQRLAMVEIAIRPYPHFVIDDREIKRSGFSYTIDTLLSLRAEFGEQTPFCFILSLDQFLQFDRWRDWQGILSLTHLIVAGRSGYESPLQAQVLSPWLTAMLERRVEDPQQLQQLPGGKVFFLESPAVPISATEIRACLQRGEDVREMLPEGVWEYILQQKLY